ncbi:hypothetical protein ABK040_014332 [Willaertia magna]
MSFKPLTHDDLLDANYETEYYSDQVLQMKQAKVFIENVLDPPSSFCEYFNVKKPSSNIKFWKDLFTEKCPEKPRFYFDTKDRVCMLISVDHDQVYDLIDFLLFFVNEGTNKKYVIEKYNATKLNRSGIGIRIRDEVFVVRVEKP